VRGLNTVLAALAEWQRGAITWRTCRWRMGQVLTAEQIERVERLVHRTYTTEQTRQAVRSALGV